MKNKKIAVLLGGISSEREVSQNTGKQIAKTLKDQGYIVFEYDSKIDLDKFNLDFQKGVFDICIPALHGKGGEDGSIQGYLETLNIPYCFSGVQASAIAMNKELSKLLAKQAGISVLDSQLIKNTKELDSFNLSNPVIAKPNQGGSSVDIKICYNFSELKEAVDRIIKNNDDALVETYLTNARELTVSVLSKGNNIQALSVMEIIANKGQFYNYDSKYSPGGSTHICPAKINKNIFKLAQEHSSLMFKLVDARDIARVDFLYDEKNNRLYFLEINTIPGMTSTSLLPEAAKEQGYEFIDLLELIIGNHIK
jgi:D-alanine-D-alanine ligase